jgi:hypothetical protein
MTDKILRITFNGICTLTPPPPRNGDPEPDKAFVLMAANRRSRKNNWNATMPKHYPFIYVPIRFLADPIPSPDATVSDQTLGTCNVYFIDHARVVVNSPPSADICYYIDKRPLATRPGSANVAPETDIRWLADFRDILQGPAPLKQSADPRAANVGPEVAVVVDLPGGVLKAGFPCKSVQPKTFRAAGKKDDVPNINRVLASEFFIDMPYPKNAKTVKIELRALRRSKAPVGLGASRTLVLKWPTHGKTEKEPPTIELRMGNDTKPETTEFLGTSQRCDSRSRDPQGHPILIPRDNDFFLHYEIIESGNKGKPLPQSGIHQIQFDGCKSGTGGHP